MPTSCPWHQGRGASGNKDILRRTESSPSGICAWLGICTAQSFSLCAGGVSSILSLPTSSPPQSQREHLQSLSYPELSVPCSCSSSSWHESEQGWGKAGLSWPFRSTALGLCHGPLHEHGTVCATGHPGPPAQPLLCPGPHLPSHGCTVCPGREQIHPRGRAGRGQGSDIPECRAELTHRGLSHRGITRHGQRLQETALTWCKHIPALCRGQAAPGAPGRNQTRSGVFH